MGIVIEVKREFVCFPEVAEVGQLTIIEIIKTKK